MRLAANRLFISPSDLLGHVDCQHLTALSIAAARGEATRPHFHDPLLETLIERGRAHEKSFVDHLRAQGRHVVEIAGTGTNEALVAQTLEAMCAGAEVIVQGALSKDFLAGRIDVLLRVQTPSTFGAWSYEVIDTKLARRTKGATVLQLCVYSNLLEDAQGCVPQLMHVVTPGTGFALESYRNTAYSAYFRSVLNDFRRFLAQHPHLATYPEPNEHCDLCAWRSPCDKHRRRDDHLCLVAGISKMQRSELDRREIDTVTALAQVPIPLRWKPERGAAPPYERVREQARIQVAGRTAGRVLYETLALRPELGLSRLPEPSPGDVFFDLEGDPFVADGGIEYLFGFSFWQNDEWQYRGEWALDRAGERRVFEAFVDFVSARWEEHPDLHVYHYAPYEPAALKRLMGRYATREESIDRMLRGGVFVDLYHVVRHAIRASVERYSIKDLEPLFAFTRATPLDAAGQSLALTQAALETGDPDALTTELKATVVGYNRDDCLAALGLRDWLEGIRSKLIAEGQDVPRPAAPVAEPNDNLSAWQARVALLIERLTRNVPADKAQRDSEQQSRWILAHLIDWHRREDKVVFWEKFRLSALADEDLLDEKAALAGLEFLELVGGAAKTPIHRYRFPPQEAELRGDEELHAAGGAKLGGLVEISFDNRTVDIKKRKDSAELHPNGIFAHTYIDTKVLAQSLASIGDFVARVGFAGEGHYGAARELLLRTPPRFTGEPMRRDGETTLESGIRIAPKLQGVLPIQGPPGTGKTHIGARMICALVRAKKKVGITANSHPVIRRLLDEVIAAANESSLPIKCVQKPKVFEDDRDDLIFAKSNDDVFAALKKDCAVAAGTVWLWARPEALESVDVLFVDEAAQLSLANVLAVSHAASALVLLGDPRQLDQPTKGTHPDGTSVSALEYLLDGKQTIGAEQGLFLDQTWRMHPRVCAFTSELFYESRLTTIDGLDRQEIRSSGRVRGSGLRYLAVEHDGNQSSSPEEARAVRDLVAEILGCKSTWVDRHGTENPVALRDILIIAPYNAQVFELQDHIPGARIGTVDKFQGQEAPIVICSMTTSTHADAPRGMSFLYSLNRLNVATSRARALCVLVASPALFRPECRTPEQMQMANAFCRYLEMAERFR